MTEDVPRGQANRHHRGHRLAGAPTHRPHPERRTRHAGEGHHLLPRRSQATPDAPRLPPPGSATDEVIFRNFEQALEFRIGDVRNRDSVASVLCATSTSCSTPPR